jgi:uncharacterized phage protein (TIGR02216 family)
VTPAFVPGASPALVPGATAPPFPWDEAIGFGLGVLRLSSDAFWRMTPRELAYAVQARKGGRTPPLARASLIDLMTRFPDA